MWEFLVSGRSVIHHMLGMLLKNDTWILWVIEDEHLMSFVKAR